MGLVEDEVQRLRDIVNGFESRIKKLEEKALLGGTESPKTTEEIRMILIGPPGAGSLFSPSSHRGLFEVLVVFRQLLS